MSELLTHSEQELRDAAALAVDLAGRRGVGARASASNNGFAKIEVQAGEVETAERSGSQSLSITVFRDGKRGSASAATFDRAAIERVVEEAILIADHVQPDTDAGLAPTEWLALTGPQPEMFAEGQRDPETLMAAAFAIDQVAGAIAGASKGTLRVGQCAAVGSEGIWALATSDGFCRSSRTSNDGRWCVMLAQDDAGSTSDYCQSQERRPEDLLSAELIAQRAADRAGSALGARSIRSSRTPVLFDARTAASLAGELAGTLTGMAQYRKMSFLADPIGRAVCASHINLSEDPFEPLGLASGGFDSEGIAGSARSVVRSGVAEGLFLSAFTARKLGMAPTGNADGFYNLRLTSEADGGDWQAMLARLGTGLVVTGLHGGSTDPASGNWTRAVNGLWVEDGAVVHPVTDVTLAGSMPAMLKGIVAIGSDVERQGAIRTGPILIDEMQIGGSA
tara:strand:- start:25969 stop:27321 length:1353 start_codon:yes stop_codon:yes gene_type:complete